ncbi:MAG: hypothetical protein IKP23_04750 [Elusimicrobiaceae bacterium]|nr:hypothetical protein [Elusimicrobiaceae bacterium]
MKTEEEILNLIASKEYDKAKEELKKRIATYPDKDVLYMLYAYCEKCILDICENEAFEDEPKSKTPSIKKEIWKEVQKDAKILADAGNYKKALTMLRLIWDNVPLKEMPYYCLGMRQERSTLVEEIAKCFFLLGEMEQAKNKYLQSIEIDLSMLPQNSPYRISFLIKKKDYKEAFGLFDIALLTQTGFDKCYTYYQRHKLHKKLGNSEEAKQDLEKSLNSLKLVLPTKPLDYNLYSLYASLLIERGDYHAALFENSKAIALWPELYTYHLQRAEIYARMKQKEKALKILTMLEKGYFHRISEYRNAEKGKVYELLGDLKTAEKYYLKENFCPSLRYDTLYDFYNRHGRQKDMENLRKEQRKEPNFQDRVSQSELINLIKEEKL